MRLLRLIGLAIIVFAAAPTSQAFEDKSNNKGKIEGTKWTNIESTVKGLKIPANLLKLEFGKDGKLVYEAGPQKFTGTYSLGNGDTVTLNLDQDLAGKKKHEEKVSIKDGRLTMADSDGTELTFEKQKDK